MTEQKLNYRGETPEEYKARRYAQRREWAKANPDKTRSYGRKHYQKNTEKRIANSKAYYHSHKEEWSAYSKEYYRRKRLADPDYYRSAGRIKRGQSEQERMISHCFMTLNKYVYAAMERDRAVCGDMVDIYMEKYPFDEFAERAIRIRIAHHGIHKGRSEYADCYDAGMLAYMYTMHRCAAMNYDHVIPYLLKMIRVYVLCALVIYNDSRNLCKLNNFREINIDNDNAQRYI